MEIADHNEEQPLSKFEENQFATVAAKNVLLGRIIAQKSLSRKVIKGMIKKGWGDPQGLTIVDLSPNTFLFNFTNPDTPNKILEEAPWNIMGHVLVLSKWNPQVSMHEIEYNHTPFWIQIHGMPLELFSKQNAIRAGNRVGSVIEVEDPFNGTSINRGFLRIKVSVNINNPLVAGFWIARATFPKVWVQIRYEKLMDFCFNCRRLGHDQRACKYSKTMDEYVPGKSMYGPWIRVAPLKNLEKPGNQKADSGGETRSSETEKQKVDSEGETRGLRETGKKISTSDEMLLCYDHFHENSKICRETHPQRQKPAHEKGRAKSRYK